MAVIVQADPFDRLIRKIGYSVGLEDLVERVTQLVALYAREGGVTAASFSDLVKTHFRRGENAVEHFANFYSQLNLVRGIAWKQVRLPTQQKPLSIPKALEPLYQLDTLSILRRMLAGDDRKYETALKVVLTQCVIEEDGDIFLNALLSDFQPRDMKACLESMIRTKRRLLGGVVRNPAVVLKINRIVNIKNESDRLERERKEPESGGRFGKRTRPLSEGLRTEPLSATASDIIAIPDDYLQKTKQSRGSWAQDLGLFRNGSKTELGSRLIAQLQRKDQGRIILDVDGRPIAIFWGYTSDLKRLHIDPEKLEAGNQEAWNLLTAIAQAWGANRLQSRRPAPDSEEVFNVLSEAFRLYREGNSSKGLIRNSLPLYIAEPVLAGWCVAEGRPIPNLEAILKDEFKKKRARRIQKMIIRGTAGALFFTKVTQ